MGEKHGAHGVKLQIQCGRETGGYKK